MGNVRMRAEMIDYGATNVKVALDGLDVSDLLELNARMDKIDAWKDTVEETELTGNPVTFNNALAVPAKSLVTTINAIQDLHGYDHPWAGGAGKNKFNPNFTGVTGITPSVDSNGYLILTISGAVSATFLKGQSIALKANTAYTLSCAGASSDVKVSLRNSDGSTIYASVEVDGGSSTYTPTEDITVYFYICVETSAALTATLKPQLEEGASATAFVRWANICPISGRTEASANDREYNMLTNTTYINAYLDGSGVPQDNANYSCSDYISVMPGINYILDIIREMSTAHTGIRIAWYTSDKTFIRRDGIDGGGASGTYNIDLTAPNNAAYVRCSYGGTVTDINFSRINTVTIQLGTTVYGADINWDTGVMTVTDGYIASYDGETLPSTWISDRDAYAEGTTPTTGAEVVYKLATPTTLQLTPTQLQMLKGYNRVSSDDADSITIKAYTGAVWGGDET